MVEVYFGHAPDEDNVRALVAAAVGEELAQKVEFGRVEQKDWIATSLEGLSAVRAGRFLVHGSHDRDGVRANDIGLEIEAALAFGTGHHGTTRGCLLFIDDILKRRRPRHVIDVGCGTGVLAMAVARALRAPVAAGDIDAIAVAAARANAELNGAGPWLRPVVAKGADHPGARPSRPLRSDPRQYSGQAPAPARAVAGAHRRAGRGTGAVRPARARRSGRAVGLCRAGLRAVAAARYRRLGDAAAAAHGRRAAKAGIDFAFRRKWFSLNPCSTPISRLSSRRPIRRSAPRASRCCAPG